MEGIKKADAEFDQSQAKQKHQVFIPIAFQKVIASKHNNVREQGWSEASRH